MAVSLFVSNISRSRELHTKRHLARSFRQGLEPLPAPHAVACTLNSGHMESVDGDGDKKTDLARISVPELHFSANLSIGRRPLLWTMAEYAVFFHALPARPAAAGRQ